MAFMDILKQYANNASPASPGGAADHFEEVARDAPPDVFRQGVADMFRADQTPPFGQMVGQLFGQSNPQQRAGMLNQLLRSLGPG
ncbi:MAG: hypothetical protein ABIX37_09105, partial [Gammaproteobacteria bacterium]